MLCYFSCSMYYFILFGTLRPFFDMFSFRKQFCPCHWRRVGIFWFLVSLSPICLVYRNWAFLVKKKKNDGEHNANIRYSVEIRVHNMYTRTNVQWEIFLWLCFTVHFWLCFLSNIKTLWNDAFFLFIFYWNYLFLLTRQFFFVVDLTPFPMQYIKENEESS